MATDEPRSDDVRAMEGAEGAGAVARPRSGSALQDDRPEVPDRPFPEEVAEPDESLIRRVTPLFKLLRLYSRLEVEGLEHLPEGPALLVANHTGWLGLDYAYTAIAVRDAKKRLVRGMAHKTWFRRPRLADVASRLGLAEANKETMRALVARDHYVMIFPEGEKGAFKSEREMYRLRPFARGYVRLALEERVPVVPVAIVGGEEANPSSGFVDSYEDLLDLTLPSPTNLFPRPVKWRISFLRPLQFVEGPEAASEQTVVYRLNDQVRTLIQNEVDRLRSVRGHPFL